MVSLTKNEARTVDFLIRNFSKRYNINQLSKELKLSPRGIFKILKKLESQKYLLSSKEGNNIFYSINYDSEEAIDVCKFVLAGERPEPYIRVQIKDLEKLKGLVKIAIIFGSVLTKGNKANDIDVILVFNEKNFTRIESLLKEINAIKTKKFHAIYQTEKDFISNIKNRDKVILSGIRESIILWGKDLFLEAIKDDKN